MRTTTVEVAGMANVLDPLGVERQLRRLSGVHRADVNFASGTATVTYDEDRTDVATIRHAILDCGFHCHGEVVPRHICASGSTTVQPEHPRAPAARHDLPERHFADSSRSDAAHAQHRARGEGTPAKTATDAMAHEMGHGPGGDMQAMVSDMRNRFWIALVFTIPIFVYSPMGGMFTPPAPPFGLNLVAVNALLLKRTRLEGIGAARTLSLAAVADGQPEARAA